MFPYKPWSLYWVFFFWPDVKLSKPLIISKTHLTELGVCFWPVNFLKKLLKSSGHVFMFLPLSPHKVIGIPSLYFTCRWQQRRLCISLIASTQDMQSVEPDTTSVTPIVCLYNKFVHVTFGF